MTPPELPKSDVVQIARCPVHGLHGERTECFVCGGEVEQVAMVPAGAIANDRAQLPKTIYACPSCPEIAALYPNTMAPVCAGADVWGTTHPPAVMVLVSGGEVADETGNQQAPSDREWSQRLAQALVDVHEAIEVVADEIHPDPEDVDRALTEAVRVIREALPKGTLDGHAEEAQE